MEVLDKSGWPNLPVIGTMIGIPQHAQPALSVLETELITLPDAYDLCPVPQPIYDIALDGKMTYSGESVAQDTTGYTTDNFYPERVAEVIETGLIRNQQVVQLRFHPFQVQPGDGRPQTLPADSRAGAVRR